MWKETFMQDLYTSFIHFLFYTHPDFIKKIKSKYKMSVKELKIDVASKNKKKRKKKKDRFRLVSRSAEKVHCV